MRNREKKNNKGSVNEWLLLWPTGLSPTGNMWRHLRTVPLVTREAGVLTTDPHAPQASFLGCVKSPALACGPAHRSVTWCWRKHTGREDARNVYRQRPSVSVPETDIAAGSGMDHGDQGRSQQPLCRAFEEVTSELGLEGLAAIDPWKWVWGAAYPSSRNRGDKSGKRT